MNTIDKYIEIKTKHRDFDDVEIDNVNLFKDGVKVVEWNNNLVITIIATICIMVITASTIIYYNYINNLGIFNLFQQFSKTNLYNPVWLRYTLLSGCLALFTYTWIMPNFPKLFPFLNKKIKYPLSSLPLKFQYLGDKKRFILYAYMSLYIIVFLLFSLFVHKLPLDFNILKAMFIILTIIPVIISAFFGSALVLYIVFLSTIKKNHPHEASYKLILYLINAIYLSDQLQKYTNISISDKDKLISLIESASLNLREIELYFENRLGKNKINYSIKSLDSYLSWVYSPEKSTFENLSNELCVYLKAAITGNYHYLPTVLKSEKNYIKNNKKNIYFGIYLAIPIIGSLIARNCFGYVIVGDIKTMFYVLYGIWVFIGLSIFMSNINADIFVVFKDLIKYILNK